MPLVIVATAFIRDEVSVVAGREAASEALDADIKTGGSA